MSKFLELMERWKAATKPDRQLDMDTALATGWIHKHNVDLWGIGAPHWYKKCEDGQLRTGREIVGYWFATQHGELPYFTASIEAALILVPAGFVWSSMIDYELPGRSRVSDAELLLDHKMPPYDGTSPALSVGIACMYAHYLNSLKEDKA